MLHPLERKIVRLALSLFQIDERDVNQVVEEFIAKRQENPPTQLLDFMVQCDLVSPIQAKEISDSMDTTILDPKSPAHQKKNGQSAAADPANQSGESKRNTLNRLGQYRLLRPLGEGGMGAVFLGYHEKQGHKVALKVLPQDLACRQGHLDRFYREAKSGALLNHENIVRNLDVGEDRITGSHYLVLEYVDGPSVQHLMDQYTSLSIPDAVHIILDIARGLEHAHSRNIIHRDIKPANILLTQTGVAKIADLGLAKRTDEKSHLTVTRQGFGTPFYMPYEQAINAKYADGRSDIYALGATLYHMITGQVPFTGTNQLEIVEKKNIGDYQPASRLNPDVPEELDEIIAKMLARDAPDRFQTASELIVDLERSELAAAVPSFIDAKKAMQDPVVRERLSNANAATCLDVRVSPKSNSKTDADRFWFVRLRDRNGEKQTAKMAHTIIIERLRQGRISPKVEACRKPKGKFRALLEYREFRNVVKLQKHAAERSPIEPRSKTHFASDSWWWLGAAGIGLGIALGVVWGVSRLFSG